MAQTTDAKTEQPGAGPASVGAAPAKQKKTKAKKAKAKKAKAKTGKKDSQLILRMDRGERDAFITLCKEMDSSAAREIRRFIRKFVKKNG